MRDAAIDTHRYPARAAGRSRAAGAPALDDMVGDGPVSRGAPRRSNVGAAAGGITSAAVAAQRLGGGRSRAVRVGDGAGALARLVRRLPRVRPLKALTIGAFGVALVGIVANAMVFQRGHHPSPLFGLGRSVDGAADPAGQRAAAAPGAPAPAAPAPSDKTGAISPAPAAAAPPAPVVAAPKPAAPVHRAAKPTHDDAAKVKTAEAPAPSAAPSAPSTAHPRPGHAAPAHAAASPKPELKSEAKPEPKSDPLGKLIAGAAHPAKPAAKPEHRAPAADGSHADRASGAVDAAPAPAHHRLAAAAPAAKPAAKTAPKPPAAID